MSHICFFVGQINQCNLFFKYDTALAVDVKTDNNLLHCNNIWRKFPKNNIFLKYILTVNETVKQKLLLAKSLA